MIFCDILCVNLPAGGGGGLVGLALAFPAKYVFRIYPGQYLS